MIPFIETVNSKEELLRIAIDGYRLFSEKKVSKNDFLMYFGFTHGEAITKFYASNTYQVLLDAGFNTGSEAYFSAGINAWKNLKAGTYTFPPFIVAPAKSSKSRLLPLQTIYYGAPGTGKSHKVKNDVLNGVAEDCIFRTTFHPDYDYASFVGCYKPKKEDDKITYSFIPQVFTNAYIKAWESLVMEEKITIKIKGETGFLEDKEIIKPVFLVIEEINRGNCAQIFGDLFQLLDRGDDGYSEYPIAADVDLKNYLIQELGKDNDGIKDGKLCLPPNLHLLATMNTSDQSLFPMDSAFKRRWDWEYVPIRYSKDEAKDDNDNFHTFTITIGKDADKKTYLWTDFLKNVNEKILSITDSEDKQMGEYFIKKDVDEKTFINKVMYYLWSEVGKDLYNSTQPFFVLPDGTKDSDGKDKKEFSFNELFRDNATALLKGFMKNLEVESLKSAESPKEEETMATSEE